MDRKLLRAYLKETEVVRPPSKRLSTFGATTLRYRLVSSIEDLPRTRLRSGTVRSEKPVIITPEAFAERFQGFGEKAGEFLELLKPAYRDLLRVLEYNFKNEGFSARVISSPAPQVTGRILAEEADSVVIRCPDGAWSLALMKMTLDEAQRSFPVNVRDLDRRGKFNP